MRLPIVAETWFCKGREGTTLTGVWRGLEDVALWNLKRWVPEPMQRILRRVQREQDGWDWSHWGGVVSLYFFFGF